jgi:hypothetical protein
LQPIKEEGIFFRRFVVTEFVKTCHELVIGQNVFLPKYALYVDYFEDEAKFKSEYQALIPEIDIESSLQIAKQEIKRRTILRENVLQRVQLVKER